MATIYDEWKGSLRHQIDLLGDKLAIMQEHAFAICMSSSVANETAIALSKARSNHSDDSLIDALQTRLDIAMDESKTLVLLIEDIKWMFSHRDFLQQQLEKLESIPYNPDTCVA